MNLIETIKKYISLDRNDPERATFQEQISTLGLTASSTELAAASELLKKDNAGVKNRIEALEKLLGENDKTVTIT